MKKLTERDKFAWTVVAATAAMGMAVMARHGLRWSWRLAVRDDPPDNPAAADVQWRHALLWTAASASVAGLARLAGRRWAAALWERWTGVSPPA